jgi:hypothetical protein
MGRSWILVEAAPHLAGAVFSAAAWPSGGTWRERARVLGRKAACAYSASTERRKGGDLVVVLGKDEGRRGATEDARFLYPAKAAPGPCARLA